MSVEETIRSHLGRVMKEEFLSEEHILREGGSTGIKLKGWAQRRAVQLGSNCWDGALTCSHLCVSRVCWALLCETILDSIDARTWQVEERAEAEAASSRLSLHKWWAGRVSSEVSGQR